MMVVDCSTVLFARYPQLTECMFSPFYDIGDGVIRYNPNQWPEEMTVPAPTVEQVEAWIVEDSA